MVPILTPKAHHKRTSPKIVTLEPSPFPDIYRPHRHPEAKQAGQEHTGLHGAT